MKIPKKILYLRLSRIRDRLNGYIADKITENIEVKLEEKIVCNRYEISGTVTPNAMYQNSTGSRMDKFLDSQELPMFVPARPEPSVRQIQTSIPEFLHSESQKRSIDEVLEQKTETFSTMLLRLIDEKGIKDSEVYKRANIDRRLFSKIRGDEDYVPSKKTVISFCLALQLTVDEAKRLLESAGFALSTSTRFDLIIMFLIENKEYNIHFANIVLEDYGEGTLSK